MQDGRFIKDNVSEWNLPLIIFGFRFYLQPENITCRFKIEIYLYSDWLDLLVRRCPHSQSNVAQLGNSVDICRLQFQFGR